MRLQSPVDVRRVFRDPLGGRVGVVGGRWVRMFGSQPVSHGHEQAIATVRDGSQKTVVSVKATGNKSAAMKKHKDGKSRAGPR